MRYITKKDLVMPRRGNKKGDNGRVLIIGGSEDYVNCLVLAGLAALRCGADWVTIAAPEKVGWAINSLSVDLVVKKLKGSYLAKKHVRELLREEKRYDIVLLGNGVTLKAKKFVKGFVKKSKKPMVLDADALKVISLKDVNNSILTPHAREFEMLLRNSGIKVKGNIRDKEVMKDVQQMLDNNIIILKGKVDEIVSRRGIYYNKTGNAGMTKAGTGDVLAGLAAGFYAQTHDALRAAKMAAYYAGSIGDILLKKKKGFTFLASDMVEEIKRVLKR